MTGEAYSDDDQTPDTDLSFSRWHSDLIPLPLSRNHPVDEESTVDFQLQFVRSNSKVQNAESANTIKRERQTGSLNDRRGIDLKILPKHLTPEQIRKKFGGPTRASESSGLNWELPPEFEDNNNSVLVSDDEFERDFGLGSVAQGEGKAVANSRKKDNRILKTNDKIGMEVRTVHLTDNFGRRLSLEEGGSFGSSDDSLQDLVEGQEHTVMPIGSVLTTLLKTLLFILIWYIFSTGLTIYNKKLLGAKLWDFPAPLLMNTIHFSMQAIISTVILRYWSPSMRPASQMSWKDYFIRVVPTAIATALDIDLTNASLVFITISFETMCKSAAPVFLLLFAFAFKLETPSFKLFGIIVIISSGVLLTGLGSLFESTAEIATDRKFELLGFILVILAAIMSGFRWTVTQVLLQKREYGLNNPFAVMSHLAPVMAIFTAVFSLASEPLPKLAQHPFFDTPHNAFRSCLLLLLGGSLAFFMVLAEYLLISRTSAVTLTVAGVVKEVVTIVVAVIFLGDRFTTLKAVGLAVIMIGISWFNWFKYQKLREDKHIEHVEFEKMPVRYVALEDKSNNDREMHSL